MTKEQWKPINTPPEDGQQVWVSFYEGGQGYAIYDDGDWIIDITDSGDFYTRSNAIKNGLAPFEISHWHPLPQPPGDTPK